MTVKGHIRGHEIYFNVNDKLWKYKENHKPIYNNQNVNCKRCNKPPIKGADFCMQGLTSSDFITSACCGHGVTKGFIVLADGRRFEEIVEDDEND